MRITPSDLEFEREQLGWSDYNRDDEQKETDYEVGKISEVALSKLFTRENISHTLKGGKGEPDIVSNGVKIDVKARNCDTQRNLIVNEGQPVNEIIDAYVLGIVHRDIDGTPVSVEFVGYIPKQKHTEKKETVEMNRDTRNQNNCTKSEVKADELDGLGWLIKFLRYRQNKQSQTISSRT